MLNQNTIKDNISFDDLEILDVKRFPQFIYTRAELKTANAIIRQEILPGQPSDEIINAFRIANNWREAHQLPTRTIKYALARLANDNNYQYDGILASRSKRMISIRKKLVRFPSLSIRQMQDLGGIRIVLNSIEDIKTFADKVRNHNSIAIKKEDDYIFTKGPKNDGYRSHHMICSYLPKNGREELYHGLNVELQIRTTLQHAWSTSVETVGLYLGKNMKSHDGDPDWLRLFELVSAEFCEEEGCPLNILMPDKKERIKELIDLSKKLDALSVLDNIKYGIDSTRHFKKNTDGYFLLVLDNKTKNVKVRHTHDPNAATLDYAKTELSDILNGQEKTNVVLVEVAKIDALQKAYPNYFGDVDFFKTKLKNILKDTSHISYLVLPPEHVKESNSNEYGDSSWMKQSRFPKPKLSLKKKRKLKK